MQLSNPAGQMTNDTCTPYENIEILCRCWITQASIGVLRQSARIRQEVDGDSVCEATQGPEESEVTWPLRYNDSGGGGLRQGSEEESHQRNSHEEESHLQNSSRQGFGGGKIQDPGPHFCQPLCREEVLSSRPARLRKI